MPQFPARLRRKWLYDNCLQVFEEFSPAAEISSISDSEAERRLAVGDSRRSRVDQ